MVLVLIVSCQKDNDETVDTWQDTFGSAVDGGGKDSQGAGAVRFDTKYDGGHLAKLEHSMYACCVMPENG